MKAKKELKMIMLKKDLKAEDVAAILGKSVSTIYGWTSDRGPQPPDDEIKKLKKSK